MGIALGLAAALCFAAASLFARVGMRTSPRDDGLFLTIVVNVVLLGSISLFVPRPPWDTPSVLALAAAGLVGVVAGRYANLRAIRFVGATRTSLFLTGAPLVTALGGWVTLSEGVGVVDALGGLLIVISLGALIVLRSTAGAVAGTPTEGHHPLLGYAFAVATPVLIGATLVIRKWGLRSFDSAVLGATIGAVAALAFFVIIDLVSGRIKTRLADNFTEINWWFVATGAAIGFAVLAQFMAFASAPAWVVSVLQGTQALWVLLLSYVFLRGDERIDLTVVLSGFGTAAGVVLIAVSL